MKKLFFTYLTFLCLMLLYQGFLANKQQLRSSSISYTYHERILKKLPDDQKKYFNLLAAFTVGDTSRLKNIKTAYKKLGLVHLFTPSGFHFQAILFLFSFSLLRRWKKSVLILSALIFFLPGFEALKRIVLIKNLELYPKKLPHLLKDRYTLFLAVFTLFFFLGDFFRNPLSFAFSFLFLGVIYAQEDLSIKSWVLTFWGLFFAQLLVQIFFPMNISLGSFFIGYLLGMLFNLLFPFMIIFYLLIISGLFSTSLTIMALWPVKFFHSIVLICSKWHLSFSSFNGTLIILLLLTGLVFQILPMAKFKRKMKILFFLSLLFSNSINLKTKKPRALPRLSEENSLDYQATKKTSVVKSDNFSTTDG